MSLNLKGRKHIRYPLSKEYEHKPEKKPIKRPNEFPDP